MPVLSVQDYRHRNFSHVIDFQTGQPEPVEEWDYEPEVPDEFDDEATLALKRSQLVKVMPSVFVEFAVKVPDKVSQTRTNFSFDQRRYLRLPYDTSSKRTLLKCGRQVEKCVSLGSPVLMGDGSTKAARYVRVGDRVASLSEDGVTMRSATVSWVSEHQRRKGVRLVTRQGHVTEVAVTHPMRTWDAWTESSRLKVGDRLAAVRRAGEFTGESSPQKERVRLTAYMLGDGHIGDPFGDPDGYLSFTSMLGPKLNEFQVDLSSTGGTFLLRKSKSKVWDVRLHQNGRLLEWLREDGLLGTDSRSKFTPTWVFNLRREDTALFLNRLWSTDGHVKQNSRSKYSLEYCSVSPRLIHEVQALLWKFGIPSNIRRNWPSYWKDQGIEQYAYILRVETQEGVRRFLSEIASLGKSEDVPLPTEDENNNRDTYPQEINGLIRRIIASRGDAGRYGRTAEKVKILRSAGLRETVKYPPTRKKIQQYWDFFRADLRYDQLLVRELEGHLSTDLYWDEIVEATPLKDLVCVDFMVEGTHNFVVDGLVSHNTTLLGNKGISYACLISSFNILYVSPTNLQTKTFSHDRIKETLDTSDILKAWTTTKMSDNIFLKKFVNRSQITLRYAYHNADRTRGIPADLVMLDEIQDIITDNIPVIEQCASHSPYKIFLYAGTPKSYDNAIEHYWQKFSTQNEWVVPCDCTGGDAGRYWNILAEENIGTKNLICHNCGKELFAMTDDAQWASMNPGIRDILSPDGVYEGFRIPQLMVPWIPWSEITDNRKKYPRHQLYNEVLGLSYDTGTRPLTRQDLMDNCWKDGDIPIDMTQESLQAIHTYLGGSSPVWAGIDWGCHDGETRILTEQRGFQYFRDVLPTEKVAQWDEDTRVMDFVVPEALTVKEWDKPLHHFEGKGLDMMLTHTHRMRVGVKSGSKRVWRTEPCERTVRRGGSVLFVGSVDWRGKEREMFTLPGLPKSSGYPGSDNWTVSMDDWLEFLGYYLSEGGLCFDGDRPSCLKMSQRESVNPEQAVKIKNCIDKVWTQVSEFPNEVTGDLNWTLYGKQLWHWVLENVGKRGHLKRIPRQFLNLSKRQLKILFDAMMLGDGNTDPREGNDNGYYTSTSKGLCEDFQELCIRLGLRSTLSLHKPADGNRKIRWRVSWSSGRDFQYNDPKRTETVPYKGKVYCCKVPKGYIVTERNGRIAYQGNTGEGSYTVLTLATYIGEKFVPFYYHRFEGQETEPPIQLDMIEKIIHGWNVSLVGADYGGGFDRNDHLQRKFGRHKIIKYQYSTPGQKVKWDDGMHRYLVHRTEVMSDFFNAVKRRDVFTFPRWENWEEKFGSDFLNIFSEYSETQRQIQYKKSPDVTDDAFHSTLLCFLVSLIQRNRLDILNPTAKVGLQSVSED